MGQRGAAHLSKGSGSISFCGCGESRSVARHCAWFSDTCACVHQGSGQGFAGGRDLTCLSKGKPRSSSLSAGVRGFERRRQLQPERKTLARACPHLARQRGERIA